MLALAAQTAAASATQPPVLIAGIAGRTAQALVEADVACGLGYHAGLLSLAAFADASEDELIEHARAIAARVPLIGFYLQPAVGGRPLATSFWRRFAALENVVGVKIAPFDRYRTLDVVRGVVAARAEDRVTLYTGNDDHIVLDLLAPYAVVRDGELVTMRMAGGLLGHWSVWTKRAVELLDRVHAVTGVAALAGPAPAADELRDLLALDARVTDCNAAFFDAANGFRGCIPGCHEVLRRQGLLAGTWCLDPAETLGPGQAAEIDRVLREHGDVLGDDDFVAAHRDRWLA